MDCPITGLIEGLRQVKRNGRNVLGKVMAGGGFCLLLIFLLFFVRPARSAIPVRFPPWLEVQTVAEEMVNGGLPTTIYRFFSPRPVEAVTSYYRQRWSGRGGSRQSVREQRLADWLVLAHLEGGTLFTLQIRPLDDASAEGFLALSRPGDYRSEVQAVPLPAGGRLVSYQEFVDGDSLGRTWLVRLPETPAACRGYYLETYSRMGWQTILDRQTESSVTLALNRGAEEMDIAITADGDGSSAALHYRGKVDR